MSKMKKNVIEEKLWQDIKNWFSGGSDEEPAAPAPAPQKVAQPTRQIDNPKFSSPSASEKKTAEQKGLAQKIVPLLKSDPYFSQKIIDPETKQNITRVQYLKKWLPHTLNQFRDADSKINQREIRQVISDTVDELGRKLSREGERGYQQADQYTAEKTLTWAVNNLGESATAKKIVDNFIRKTIQESMSEIEIFTDEDAEDSEALMDSIIEAVSNIVVEALKSGLNHNDIKLAVMQGVDYATGIFVD